MMIENKKVLVLAPHIDDAEFGCGGTIDKLVKANCEVYYLAFSNCEESIPNHLPKQVLNTELEASSKLLNIDRVDILGYKVRRFDQDRQAILQDLIDIKKDWNPDVVFTPSTKDIHQDHQVITNECIRAFKHCSIFGYELPWNCLSFSSELLITISEDNLKTKIDALMCYESQLGRIYHNPEYLRSLAVTRGLRINKPLAEAFELIRLIID